MSQSAARSSSAASSRIGSPRLPGQLPDAEGDGRSYLPHEDGPIFTSFKQELAPYAAEAFGTFLMTLTFLLNYSDSSNPTWGCISNGFMNMVLKYAFDHISGANLNPSLTISLMLAGRTSFRVSCKIILAQIVGACCAGSLRFSVGNANVIIGPNPGYNWGQVAFIEITYTALLSFVFLNCSASTRNNPRDDKNGFFGLAVGFVFIAGSYAGMAFCHAVLNSAVAIGITIVDFRMRGAFSWAGPGYLLHDIIGAFVGTWLYRLVRPLEFDPVALQNAGAVPNEPRGHQAASRVCAEFIGTFYVVLTKCLNRTSETASEPWSMMALISALVYSLRDVSGAYFNPAVTVSVALSRRGILEVPIAVWDIIIQLFAGSMATGICAGITRHDATIRSGHSSGAAVAVVESTFTCLTCYVVLATCTTVPRYSRTKCNNIAGIAYGACHMVSGVAAKNISGSVLNPVVALAFSGLNAIEASHESCTAYIFYELVGAVVAACIFFVTHAHEYAGVGDAKAGGPDFRVPAPEPAAGAAQA